MRLIPTMPRKLILPNKLDTMSSHIHEKAIVADGAVVGNDCHIGPFCTIGTNVKLGDRVRPARFACRH